MKALNQIEAMQELCKATKKFGMYISGNNYDEMSWDEMVKAAPYLGEKDEQGGYKYFNVLLDDYAILIFDTREEMEYHFNLTVGDDGPTKLNPYNGPARWYALTCNNGELETENT